MKTRGITFAISLLVLTLGGLAVSSHAQQTKVKFKFKDVTVPTAVESSAFGINNKKEIVGDYIDEAGAQEAMFAKGNNVTSVSCPAGPASFSSVNSAGSATESMDDDDTPCGNGIPIYYFGPHPHWGYLQQDWGSILTESLAINDGNQVAGLWQDPNQTFHGFLYDLETNTFTPFDPPGQLEAEPDPHPWGLNKWALLVLWTVDPASGLAHSYLFDGTSFTQIDVPGALQSFAHGINGNGDIVYTVQDANGDNWGVFFYATLRQFYYFNQPDGRDNTRAYGLNDEVQTKAGIKLEIVGDYTLPGSSLHRAYEATVTIKP
jgi:hypothetical protein